MKKTLLLLCGGKSDEHEISLISAKGILDALDRNRFTPVVVGISREGVWHLEDEASFFTGEFRADKIRLNTKTPTVKLQPFLNDEGRGVLSAAEHDIAFDVVFPILHGSFGEDGTIQGMFDIVGVPYVGSNCGSSWLCMDKAMTKTLCHRQGIASAKFVSIQSLAEAQERRDELRALTLPIFVKPARTGSSVGIRKVTRYEDLESAVQYALEFDSKCVVEQGVVGRELECAVLGLNRNPKVALPGEVVPSAKVGFYSYEAKYLMADGAEIIIPAKLDAATTKKVQEFAKKVYQVLECDGMARVDVFLTPANEIYLNEVNTIPGFTPISMYPKMWQSSNLPYPELISELLDLAVKRLEQNRSAGTIKK